MMTQRQAVFSAVQMVIGEIRGKVELDKPQRKQVEELVVQMFLRGEVELRESSTKPRTPEYIKGYVPGLVNNWLRKDKQLNGNVTYQTKNPGSRTGAGDDELKNLKALLAVTTIPEHRVEIEAHIKRRTEELAAAKIPDIDYSKLPESLRPLAERIAPKIRKASNE